MPDRLGKMPEESNYIIYNFRFLSISSDCRQKRLILVFFAFMAPLLKKPWVLSLICFGLMAAAAAWFLWRFPPRQGRLVFLNVGQGDSILIETPEGHRVLIDDGPDDAVLSALGRQLGFLDRTIDMLLITHPDRDHYGGTLDLLDRYEVKRVLLTGVVSDDAFYEAFRKKISDLGIPVTLARVNEDWRLSARARLQALP